MQLKENETRICPRCEGKVKFNKDEMSCRLCGDSITELTGVKGHCRKCWSQIHKDMQAEREFGLRSNFDPGTTVVNILTGEKTVVPH